ncbi:MAG: PKD-like domain-containing protein, partial [Bacteroidota bacterium]
VVATINPKPVVPPQTATICSGTAFTTSPTNNAPTTIIPTGTTYTWTVVDDASVTGESNQATGQSSISQTLTNNTNTAKTVVYTVTPTSGDAGSCVGTPFTVTVTVNPTPVVPNQTVTICSGGTFTRTPVDAAPTTIIPSGTTYTWTVAPNADVTGETDQAVGQSSISQTLTNTSNTVQTVVYTVTPKSGTTGACVGATFTVTVTVNPRPTVDAISNQAVCAGSTVSGVTITGSVASTVYTWANNTTSIGLGASGTGNITSFTGTNVTNLPVVATVTVTPTYTNNSVACVGSTSTFTITINPRPVIANKTATICSGAAFTIAPSNSGSEIVPASTTYTWTVVDNTNVTGDEDQATGQSNISQTLTNLTNTAQTVVYTVTPTSGAAGNCVGSTFTVTVTVNPKANIANKTASSCSGTGFTVTPSNGGGDIVPSGTTYAWSAPTVTGSLTGGALATGQSSISGTLTNPTNIPQTATYTVTPTSGTCTGPTFTVVATINPKPVVPPQTATICSGTAFTTSPTNNAPTTIIPTGTTYTWTV